MREDPFVITALEVARSVLSPPLFIKQGASLLYQVTVDNKLEVSVDPKNPKRGQSAFQTDLCIFESVDTETNIPRVVLEFKKGLSTHDVLIYSSKARKHKQIYPYLRYGIIIGDESKVPGKFYIHNEALDFCFAAKLFKNERLPEIFAHLFRFEVKASRLLEDIAFGKTPTHLFRSDVLIEEELGTVF